MSHPTPEPMKGYACAPVSAGTNAKTACCRSSGKDVPDPYDFAHEEIWADLLLMDQEHIKGWSARVGFDVFPVINEACDAATRLREELTLDAPYPAPALACALLQHWEGRFKVVVQDVGDAYAIHAKSAVRLLIPKDWPADRQAEAIAGLAGLVVHHDRPRPWPAKNPEAQAAWLTDYEKRAVWAQAFGFAFLDNETWKEGR